MRCTFEEAIYGLTSHPSMGKEFNRKLNLIVLGINRFSVAEQRKQSEYIDGARDENGMPLIYFHNGEFIVVEENTRSRIQAYRTQEHNRAKEKRDSGIIDAQRRYQLLKEAGAV